jgi:hypothetical protein
MKMAKRYRAPKCIEGEIKFQKGKVDGDIDMCIFYGGDVPRCDQALVINALCSERQYTNLSTMRPAFERSLIDELEARGYDLETLRFSIKRKTGKH